MVWYRYHRGGLYESILTTKRFDNFGCLVKLLNGCGNDSISFHPYDNDGDERIGWRDLLIVLRNGRPIGFASTDVDEVKFNEMIERAKAVIDE